MTRTGRSVRRLIGPLGGTAAGVVLLLGGGAALIASQPWHVAHPLLLTGFIVTLVCSLLLPKVRQASEVDEHHVLQHGFGFGPAAQGHRGERR